MLSHLFIIITFVNSFIDLFGIVILSGFLRGAYWLILMPVARRGLTCQEGRARCAMVVMNLECFLTVQSK